MWAERIVVKMIKLIVGEKGMGKTKSLLDSVHKAANTSHGAVVFINNNSTRHIHDFSHAVRMVDTSDFPVSTYDELYGLLCGIVSQNFDTTHIFIDSLTKIVAGTEQELESFMERTNGLCAKFNIQMLITISANVQTVGEHLKKYIA